MKLSIAVAADEVGTEPTAEQLERLASLSNDGIIHLLALTQLRHRARYADGRDVSGRDAYGHYERESYTALRRVHGRRLSLGSYGLMLVGPEREQWDVATLTEFPCVDAYLELLRDPDYSEAALHRRAAVQECRLICMSPTQTW